MIEDYGRYRSDKAANQSFCLKIYNGKIIKMYWKDLVCGDLVLIQKDTELPADI